MKESFVIVDEYGTMNEESSVLIPMPPDPVCYKTRKGHSSWAEHIWYVFPCMRHCLRRLHSWIIRT